MVIIAIVVVVLILLIGVAYYTYTVVQHNIKLKEAELIEYENTVSQNKETEEKNKELREQYEYELEQHKDRLARLSNPQYAKGGIDCPGNDIGNKLMNTADECMKWCDDTPECAAAGWVRDSKKCWLKSGISNCNKADRIDMLIKDVDAYNAEEARIILEENERINNKYRLKLQETEQEQQALYNKYAGVANQIKSYDHTKDGIDCAGSIKSIDNVENAYECLNQCNNIDGCKGIVYGKNSKKCWPMREFRNCYKNQEYVTSFNSPSDDWDPHLKRFQDAYNARNDRLTNPELTKVGLDCSGNDIANYTLPKNECLERCDNTPGCVASIMRDGRCWLKSKLDKCALSTGTLLSIKDPSVFSAEKERLANTLLPEEQARKELIDSCKNLNIPSTPKDQWSQDMLQKYNNCEAAGILNTL